VARSISTRWVRGSRISANLGQRAGEAKAVQQAEGERH
jgi:hypothetical protein